MFHNERKRLLKLEQLMRMNGSRMGVYEQDGDDPTLRTVLYDVYARLDLLAAALDLRFERVPEQLKLIDRD